MKSKKIVSECTTDARKMIGRKKTYGTTRITELLFLGNKRKKSKRKIRCKLEDFVDKTYFLRSKKKSG